MTTIRDQIAEQLAVYATGPTSAVLPSIAEVQVREEGRWLSEASGSSVAWLAAAADDASDFGPVRIVTRYGAVLAGEGATA